MLLKRLGDRVIAVPATMMWSKDGNEGPTAHVTFDVIDGQLQCIEAIVRRQPRPGQREVTRADLRAVPINDLRDQVAELHSAPYERSEGGTTVRVVIGGEEQEREARRTVAATRRGDDIETLRQVAEVYLSHPHAPTRAVADAFGMAHRTAGVYVQRAREVGLVPPAKRRKAD